MAASQTSAADKLAAALKSIGNSYKVPVTTSPESGTCLHTLVGDLCCLVVPNRAEVEIDLVSTFDGSKMTYPLNVLQAAVGLEPRAIMYHEDSFSTVVKIVSDFIIDVLAVAQTSPDTFSERIRFEYDDMLAQARRKEIRYRATSFWNSGRYNEAVVAYKELPELTPVERRRVALIESGKTPRPRPS
jgi:hypothetical protein